MFEFLDPQKIIPIVGLIGIGIIVFAEAGLLIGVFLPGDSLVFTAAVFASQGYFSFTALFLVCLSMTILGDQCGYYVGRRFGSKLFEKEESLFFKKSYVHKAQHFFDIHGKKTVLIARFIPVVRTFVPTLAGISKMQHYSFLLYNITGAFLWVSTFCFLGYLLGNVIGSNTKLLSMITITIIFLSVCGGFISVFFAKKHSHKKETL